MSEKDEINVVDDQIGNPTYAKDLAEAIMQIVVQLNSNANFPHQNMYHYSNTGNISWFQFAKEIKEKIKTNCVIHPIRSSKFPTPAKRSTYSVLDCSSIQNDFGVEIKNWEISLEMLIGLMV